MPRRDDKREGALSMDGRDEALELRIVELEAKLALSEDLQESLNLALYRQQQHIDRIERELRALRDQVEAAGAASEPGAPASLRDEIPPHY